MENRNFEDITVTELVEVAGVSRVSFYRNFDSKKDILTQHLRFLFRQWATDFESRGDPAYFSESLLRHFYDNKAFYLLLYRHGMSNLVFEAIRWAVKMDEAQNNLERYTKSAFAGLIFGSVDEWMRQGMQESPEEILLLTDRLK